MMAQIRHREATIEDSQQLAGVHTRSWQVAYRGQLPDAFLDGLDPRDRVAGWQLRLGQPGPAMTLVAVDDRSDRIVGFIVVGPSRDGYDHSSGNGPEHPAGDRQGDLGDDGAHRCPTGEVYAIYVDPPWWGRRIGAALLIAGMQRLRRHGFVAATLWVLGGNERSQRFYERHGWRRDGEHRSVRIAEAHPDVGETGGVTVSEVRYAITLPMPASETS